MTFVWLYITRRTIDHERGRCSATQGSGVRGTTTTAHSRVSNEPLLSPPRPALLHPRAGLPQLSGGDSTVRDGGGVPGAPFHR